MPDSSSLLGVGLPDTPRGRYTPSTCKVHPAEDDLPEGIFPGSDI